MGEGAFHALLERLALGLLAADGDLGALARNPELGLLLAHLVGDAAAFSFDLADDALFDGGRDLDDLDLACRQGRLDQAGPANGLRVLRLKTGKVE